MKLTKLMMIGRLVRDCEARVFGDKSLVSFTIATDEGYKGKDGEWVDKAEFTDCSYFTSPKGADYIVPRLTKGELVYVEGRKQTDISEKDGVKKYFVKCMVSEVRPLTAKGKATGQQSGQTQQQQPYQADPFTDGAPF